MSCGASFRRHTMRSTSRVMFIGKAFLTNKIHAKNDKSDKKPEKQGHPETGAMNQR